MDHDQSALLARHRHHIQDLAIGQRQPLIGHEDLETGVPGLDQRRQVLPKRYRIGLLHDQVEGDVAVTLAFGLGVILRHRRARGRGKVVRHLDSRAGGLRDMNTAVDPARHGDQPARVDDLGRRAKVKPQRADPSTPRSRCRRPGCPPGSRRAPRG